MTSPPPRPPVWRRIVGHPLVWSAICGLGAGLLSPVMQLDFPVFLLTLLCGWLAAHWFVGVTLRMRPARWGTIAHVAGWVWITLLSRITAGMRERETAAPLSPPEWQSIGTGAEVRFRAVAVSMRALTWSIVVTVIVAGALTVALLIVAGSVVDDIGPRLAIIGLGALVALPAYVLLRAALRRRTVDGSVQFARDAVHVEIAGRPIDVAFRDLLFLRWRTDSDYARVEVRSDAHELSLIVGLARQPAGVAAALPPLSRRVENALATAGLRAERSKRGTVTYRRAEAGAAVTAGRTGERPASRT